MRVDVVSCVTVATIACRCPAIASLQSICCAVDVCASALVCVYRLSVCLCVCFSVSLCLCASVPLCLCASVPLCACVSVCVCLCLYLCLRVCLCLCLRMCLCLSVSMHKVRPPKSAHAHSAWDAGEMVSYRTTPTEGNTHRTKLSESVYGTRQARCTSTWLWFFCFYLPSSRQRPQLPKIAPHAKQKRNMYDRRRVRKHTTLP